uniref:Uncharacterized protein n=1 Tax=Arundo donax TaxID=35708 RepID=A0A0A9FJM4_ARUDO
MTIRAVTGRHSESVDKDCFWLAV